MNTFRHDTSLKTANDTAEPTAENEHVVLEASEQFVNTPYVQELTERALTYLAVGCAVHLAGPAGTGKTTLALHVAAQLQRPVMLLHGDHEFTSSDLVGRGSGYRKSRVVDNFVHSVLKTEEQMTPLWMNHRLTTACEQGYVLIYDEFNRSQAEANNALLSVLAERILNLPNQQRRGGNGFIEVHPQFRAIFTSNPEEYVGAHKTPDALMDRMVTIDVNHPDRQTEIQIIRAKSGIGPSDAEVIVDLIRHIRGKKGHRPTIRAAIAIAKVLVHRGAQVSAEDPVFQWVCRDIAGIDATTLPTLVEEIYASERVEETEATAFLEFPPSPEDNDSATAVQPRQTLETHGENIRKPTKSYPTQRRGEKYHGHPAQRAE